MSGTGEITAANLVRGTNLPTLPEAYLELRAAIDSETTDIEDIAKLLTRDPVMCAKTLKLANSAYFSSGRSVETIDDAIHIIGTDVLATIAMSVYVLDVFFGIDSDLVDMKKFWKQSIRMGISAGRVAKFCLSSNQYTDRFFIASMLSRIGKLVLYIESPEIASEVIKQAEEEHVPKFFVEEKILGFTHAAVSYELLKLWGLPPTIYEPVLYYIYPENVPSQYMLTAYLIHAAYYMQFAWFHNGEANFIDFPSRTNDRAFEYLKIRTMDLMMCTNLIDDEFQLLCNNFNLD